jgi:hypothetical protein
MKIVQLSSAHTADDNRIFKICRSVANAGHDVSFVVPAEQDCQMDGVAIKAVPAATGRGKRMLFSTVRVYRRAVQEAGDVYQFHDPELIPVGLALQHLHRKQVVYDVHEDVPQQILGKAYIPALVRKPVAGIYDRFERWAAKRFAAITTANEDIDKRFHDCNGRVLAIHNYAEAEEFGETLNDDSRYRSGLIFHSGASERTAFPAVLQALALMVSNTPFRLVATANSASESREAAQIADRTLSDRLELLGSIPRAEMIKVLQGCAVSLVLYNEYRNHSSIRANRFFESLAAGAPVIVPDFPEWRAAVKEIGCGLAVNPNDPQSIANALQFLLSQPRQAAAMGARGRRAWIESFSWTQEKNRLLQLYDELVPTQHVSRPTAAQPISERIPL